jgi:uncharacterized protein
LQTGGEFTVAVARPAAFAFLSDPFALARCIPGCSDLRETAPGRYAAKLTNRVGPISVAFASPVELTNVVPPSALDAVVTGNAAGLGGRLTATAAVRLAAVDELHAAVTYTVDLALTGKLGGIGQPVFRAKSDELSKMFGANVRAALESGATANA